jgi:hypothetical protein
MRVSRAMALGWECSAARSSRADDVGCCQPECQWWDGVGRGLPSVRVVPLTEEDCRTQFDGCDVSWTNDACPKSPVGLGARPDVRVQMKR